MKTETIATAIVSFQHGQVSLTLARITTPGGAQYYEAAHKDTRPLDLRKHRHHILVSHTDEASAWLMFGSALAGTGQQSRNEIALLGHLHAPVQSVN